MFHIIFMGTPDFAVPALEELFKQKDFSIDLVVTQPDAHVGRGLQLKACAVKEKALELGLRCIQPEKLRTKENLQLFQELKPDFVIVVAYGKIISSSFLNVPRFGTINLHGSLLPKYRGASPIQAALLHGEKETGVSVMLLTEGMDEGPVLATTHTDITTETTSQTLFSTLSKEGGEVLPDILRAYAEHSMTPVEQDHTQATYCTKINKEDGRVLWDKESAQSIFHKWQAFTPWPGVFTTIDGKLLKLHHIKPSHEHGHLRHGQLLFTPKHLYIGTALGALEVLEVQPEGKKRMSARDFMNGNGGLDGKVCE